MIAILQTILFCSIAIGFAGGVVGALVPFVKPPRIRDRGGRDE